MLRGSIRFAGGLAVCCVCLIALQAASSTQEQKAADEKALEAAQALRDPGARLNALNKVRKDFPKSGLLNTVDREIFYLLVERFPDRAIEIGQSIDRLQAHVGADGSMSARFSAALEPATELIGRRILLDRAETLLAQAESAMNFDAFAKSEREFAEKAKRPAPTEQANRTRFAQVHQTPLGEQKGRLLLAKGDLAGAERVFGETWALKSVGGNPPLSLSDVYGELADAYAAKGDRAHADQMLQAVNEANPDIQRMYLVRALFYAKHDQIQPAKDVVMKRLSMKPATFVPGELLLAKLDSRSGDYAASLARYLRLAAGGDVHGSDYDTMVTAYRKVHGSDAGLDAEIDRLYRERFPNPIKPEKWTPPAGRGSRLVVAQLFTGSGCNPCIAADLSIDAMMERYPVDAVVPLLYHVHWPRPDPMAISAALAFADAHVTEGVPTLFIDGKVANDEQGVSLGGGPRAEAPNCYKTFIAPVDKALMVAPTAEISVTAQANGDQVDVSATVSKLPPGAKGLRLQLVLAERELKFSGENSIRFHPMVVRATNSAKADGIPLAGTGTQKHTFKLEAIRDDITRNLADEIAQRKSRVTRSANAQAFAAEGRAMTKIDVSQLVVVAFVQDAKRQILQAARTDVR